LCNGWYGIDLKEATDRQFVDMAALELANERKEYADSLDFTPQTDRRMSSAHTSSTNRRMSTMGGGGGSSTKKVGMNTSSVKLVPGSSTINRRQSLAPSSSLLGTSSSTARVPPTQAEKDLRTIKATHDREMKALQKKLDLVMIDYTLLTSPFMPHTICYRMSID
jgi:hypothetical protein